MYRAQLVKEVLDHSPKSYQHSETKAATWWSDEWQSRVFTDEELLKRIPKNIYDIHKSVVKERGRVDEMVADVVAKAMKEWAISHGATHYTHWFQPIHMSSAEKHEAFIDRDSSNKTIMVYFIFILIHIQLILNHFKRNLQAHH